MAKPLSAVPAVVSAIKSAVDAPTTIAIKAVMIALVQISLGREYHFRVKNDRETVAAYTDIYKQYSKDKEQSKSASFPLGPIMVFQEGKGKYVVVGGGLRFLAAKKAKLDAIPGIGRLFLRSSSVHPRNEPSF